MKADHQSGQYWDHIVTAWNDEGKDPLWRQFADRQQSHWAETYLVPAKPERCFKRLLKTDLFDEAVAEGVVPTLTRLATEVWGVDVSAVVVERARQRYSHLRTQVASIQELPFDDGSFDAIFSGSTLDHFESREQIQGALRELHRVLAVHGKLFLTLDNPSNPLIWLRNGPLRTLGSRLGWFPYQVGQTLSRKALLRALAAAGFETHLVTALQHCPRWWAIRKLNRLEQQADPVRQRSYQETIAQFEWLQKLPTRFFTGHYVAALAIKR